MREIEGPSGRIALRDSGGSGRALVFLHGNSASSRAYARQFEGPLCRSFRLVAYDLSGHGQSADAEDDAAYLLSGHARTLLALTENLGLQDAVFVGWSLGGHVLLEAAPDLARAAGFALFGTPPVDLPAPLDRAFLPHPALGIGFSAELTREQIEAYARAGLAPDAADIPAFFIEDIARCDGRARVGVGASVAPGVSRDEAKIVAELTQPLAILHGERDQFVNPAYFGTLKAPTLWRGAVQVIPGAGHTPQWEAPAAFDALIGDFARDCG
jgi:pimeloyl-ACP methyl ester carboxylesterase